MNNHSNNLLKEIKKGKTGQGLLIENDGYITSTKESLKEDIGSISNNFTNDGDWFVPNPFIVSAVFQKYGIKNANGRIYPEDILKREVERYQQRIKERRAYGECYTPDVLVLTESGWKVLKDIKEGENIITLNVENNEIEIKPVIKKIELDRNDKMIRIKGYGINDLVTPNHGYPIYSKSDNFKGFYDANEILNRDITEMSSSYIPKKGIWTAKGDNFFTLKAFEKTNKNMIESYPDADKDLKIPMPKFMKFLGVYYACGSSIKLNKTILLRYNDENYEEINEILNDLGFYYQISKDKDNCFVLSDPRLYQYTSSLGNKAKRFIPSYIKNQSKSNLKLLYYWFLKANNNKIISISKHLILDLNEVQLKIGLNGTFNCINNNIKLYESNVSLTRGINLSNNTITASEEDYKGKVMCLEVENHTFFVMSNGFTHWSKNCNHPAESTIDLGRISHNIIELHWEGSTLVGKMEIFTSEGFRKQGIVSTLGDMIANLILSGYKIGVSSRAVGSVESKLGTLIVGDDLELICWDCVADPSTPNAYVDTDEENLQQYIENKEMNKNKLISEKINKLKKLL